MTPRSGTTRSKALLAVIAALIATTALSPAAFGTEAEADSKVKGDLRTVANVIEWYFVEHQHLPTKRAVTYNGARRVKIGQEVVRLSRGNRLGALLLTAERTAFCVHVVRAEDASDTSGPWSLVSDTAEIISDTCPERFSRSIA